MRPQNRQAIEPGFRAVTIGLVALSAVFYLLYFLHLRADFPNHTPWHDWSKMTDEGWYAGGAIQYYASGSWYQPETFNSAPALPVWPLLMAVVFKLTGVSMLAARFFMVLLSGGTLGLVYALMRRVRPGMPAAVALLLVVVNPLCYVFDRLALLEPAMIFWWMLALWLAGAAWRRDTLRAVCLGFVLCLMILTKTTGVALIPSAVYLIYCSGRSRTKDTLRPALISCAVAAVCWGTYYMLVIRSRYAGDFHFLFSVNDQDHAVPRTLVYMVHHMLMHGDWINLWLFDLGAAAVLISLVWLRELWRIPLFFASVIAVVSYMSLLVYHGSFQPRYYLPLVIPMVFVVVLAANAIWERGLVPVAVAAGVVLAGVVITMAKPTVQYILHPQYSFYSAAQQIAAIVRSDPGAKQFLLSRSGRNIELFTHLPSASDEFAPHGLDAVLGRYQPQWYAAWLPYEKPTVDDLSRRYRLVEMAHYIVFDEKARNNLVLYRLEPR